MMNIDKSKWEKIAPTKIESGDHLLVVRTCSISHIDPGSLEGVVGKDKDNDWLIAGWKATPTSLHDLIVYKKRPEFVLPTALGAVITAESERDEATLTFVFADPNPSADLPWYSSDEEWYSGEEIMHDFDSHTVVSEGVVL